MTDKADAGDQPSYAFLAVYHDATLRFDAPVADAEDVVTRYSGLALPGTDPGVARAAIRSIVRDGFLDNDHLNPAKSQRMAEAIIWLCLTCDARAASPSSRGFILLITNKGGDDFNFRYMVAENRQAVDDYTAEVRKGRKYVVSHTPEDVAKALSRKRTPPPRDPNLEPPQKPRPERWLPALETQERLLGKAHFDEVRRCLDEGALFVWRSRQIADAAQEEINASLGAMAEYGRLRLPFPMIWAETRDWIDVPVDDAPPKRLPARFGIAATQVDDAISFWGFVDVQDHIQMSVLHAEIDRDALIDGSRHLILRPPHVPERANWDESAHRRIAFACGDRLLELLFLLSTSGVAKDRVREGSGGKPGKRSPKQRRMTPRDYTIVRVPLTFQPDVGGTKGDGTSGRWVRPHARRAHMWGKNTRPLEEQHWREATLVGAAKVEAGEEVRRPEYRVG